MQYRRENVYGSFKMSSLRGFVPDLLPELWPWTPLGSLPHTRVIGTQMAMVSRYSPRPYLHLVNNTEWYLRLYKWRINEWMNEIASFTVGAENPETSLVYRTRPRTTLCLKKVPTFKLSVTLSNLIRFSKFLHCWKAYEICYKTHMTPPTSP